MSDVRPKYHDHSRLNDPKVVGPGIWYTIHSEAKEAVDEKSSQAPIQYIYRRQSNFTCPKCKIHFGEYLAENNPFILDFSNHKALFHWTVDFHNNVNQRTGKALLSYEEAEALYYTDAEFCTATCEEVDMNEIKEEKIPSPTIRAVTFKPIL